MGSHSCDSLEDACEHDGNHDNSHDDGDDEYDDANDDDDDNGACNGRDDGAFNSMDDADSRYCDQQDDEDDSHLEPARWRVTTDSDVVSQGEAVAELRDPLECVPERVLRDDEPEVVLNTTWTDLEKQQQVARVQFWLARDHPECSPMPSKNKVPGLPHAGMSAQQRWDDWANTGREKCVVQCDCALIVLLYNVSDPLAAARESKGGLIVIDIDKHGLVRDLVTRFPHIADTAMQQTSKGCHFFFRRSVMCEQRKVTDKAGAVHYPPKPVGSTDKEPYKIDIKTVCSNGTGGCIVVCPSPNKAWIRAPWKYPPITIPDDFLAFLLTHHKDYKVTCPIIVTSGPLSQRCTIITPSSAVPSDPSCAVVRAACPVQVNMSSPSSTSAAMAAAVVLTPQAVAEPADATFIRDLFDCLDPQVVEHRGDWITVGMALHCHGRGSDDYFALWVEFSRRSHLKFMGVADCRKNWKSFKYPMPDPTDLGTLCDMAREANELAYLHAQAKVAAHPSQYAFAAAALDCIGLVESDDNGVVQGLTDTHPDLLLELCLALQRRWPVELGAMSPTAFRVTKPDVGGTQVFADPTTDISGTVSWPTCEVFLTQPSAARRFLGLLWSDVVVRGPLTALHNSIPTAAIDYLVDRPEHDRATLTSRTPRTHGVQAMLTLFSMGCHGSFIEVNIPGKKDITLAAPNKVDMLHQLVASAVNDRVAESPLAWFYHTSMVVHGDVNINVGKNDDRVRPDYGFLSVLRHSGYAQRVVAITETEFYILDAATNVWILSTLGNAAGLLRSMAAGGLLQVGKEEAIYLQRYDGANRVVKSVFNELQDRGFVAKLDTLTPRGCVAMDDGMYDASDGSLRPFAPQDFVCRTIGYPFTPTEALLPEDVGTIATFYDQVFPDPVEREYFLRLMAAALFGSGRSKHFLILTDDRDGANGKSSCMRAVEMVFGRLKANTERSFLNVSTSNDPNAPASNLLAYAGARLAFFDEPDKDAKLDIRRIKDLCSGASIQSGRACHGKVVEEFEWQALIVLACNEANFPVMDVSDRPFLKRMKSLRMRSLFVDQADIRRYDKEPLVFASLGENLLDLLKSARSAHFHVLAATYRRLLANDGVGAEPPSVQDGLRVVMESADPRFPEVLDFLRGRLDFNPTRSAADKGKRYYAWVSDKDLVNHFWEANKVDLKRNKEKKSDYHLLLRRGMEFLGHKLTVIHPLDRDSGRQLKLSAFDHVAFLA